MKMYDMGHKMEGIGPKAPKEDKECIHYPTFTFTGDAIPDELKDVKTGNQCRVEIIVRKVGDGIDTYGNREPRVEVEVLKAGYIGKAGKATKEEYLAKSQEERDEYDKKEVMEGDSEGKDDHKDDHEE